MNELVATQQHSILRTASSPPELVDLFRSSHNRAALAFAEAVDVNPNLLQFLILFVGRKELII